MTEYDRNMIVSMLRWGRANGWRKHGNWDSPWWSKRGVYRIFLDWYEPDGALHIRVDDKVAGQGLFDYWPRSVAEAARVLVALEIMPLEATWRWYRP